MIFGKYRKRREADKAPVPVAQFPARFSESEWRSFGDGEGGLNGAGAQIRKKRRIVAAAYAHKRFIS
jgi:hypothetical protein